MRSSALRAPILLAALTALPLRVAPLAAQPIAFVGATVLPMDRSAPLRDHTVIVQDGKIVAVGPRASTKVPANATQVNARGKYLMPGLVDMHAHLAQGPADGVTDGAGRQLATYLTLGITSVRALAAPPSGFAVKQKVASGAIVAPRLWVTGQSINAQSAPTADAVVKLVETNAKNGADHIKTHGMWKERAPYDSLVAASKRAGLPLAGHVTPEFGLAAAVNAGQQIEHLDGVIAALAAPGVAVPPGQFVFDLAALASVDSARVDSLARDHARRRVYHGPTLALFRLVGGGISVDSLLARPDLAYTPQAAVNQWTLQLRNLLQQPAPEGGRAQYMALRDLIVRRFAAAGVPMLAGSDSPQLFMTAGFGLHRELEAMVQAGLTPYQALLTATRTPAEYFGRAAQSGVIKTGYDADIVLLDADPMADIRNTMKVNGTMVRGTWIGPEQRAEMIGKLKG